MNRRINADFWLRGVGNKLPNNHGAQMLSLYLFSSPFSNKVGVYRIPIIMMAKDLGYPLRTTEEIHASLEEIKNHLSDLETLGFLKYDYETEFIFMKDMARWNLHDCSRRVAEKLIVTVLLDAPDEIQKAFKKEYLKSTATGNYYDFKK